ncbi:MAG TPA: hypothetical protein VFQ72_01775 [Candidatus Paceibacterota bacterium]|nr:hypothetical protein [Candidatus Paceibacterota bacterium]
MIKKSALAFAVAVLALTASFVARPASAVELTLGQMVDLFINLGIIEPAKAPAARAFVAATLSKPLPNASVGGGGSGGSGGVSSGRAVAVATSAGATSPSVSSPSLEAVSIVAPASVSIVAPTSGESYATGAALPIRWDAVDFPAGSTLYIELRSESMASTTYIATVASTDAAYSWKIPGDIASGKYYVEVYKADASGSIDPNESVKARTEGFYIIAPLKLLSPNGGETYKVGDTLHVTWTGGDPRNQVQLTLFAVRQGNPAILPVSPFIANRGSYDWVIPASPQSDLDFTMSDYSGKSIYSLGIVALGASAPGDSSDNGFAIGSTVINESPVVTVDSTTISLGQTVRISLKAPANAASARFMLRCAIDGAVSAEGDANICNKYIDIPADKAFIDVTLARFNGTAGYIVGRYFTTDTADLTKENYVVGPRIQVVKEEGPVVAPITPVIEASSSVEVAPVEAMSETVIVAEAPIVESGETQAVAAEVPAQGTSSAAVESAE